MLPTTRISSLLCIVAALAACGGGSPSAPGPAQAGAGLSSTTSSTTTSTAGPSATTTTTAYATSTTASTSSTSAVPTTTASVSTTTMVNSAPNAPLPPLAATPIVLSSGPSGTLGVRTWSDGNTASGGRGNAVGNVQCVSYDYWNIGYFIHAHVSIFRDGQRLALPQYIGMAAECLYEINTDNMSGAVDVFSERYKRLTLGDLFAVWGQPLSWTNVAGFAGQPVTVYIEDQGVLTRHTGDIGDIELAPYRSITIQIGAALPEIPTYDWSRYDSH